MTLNLNEAGAWQGGAGEVVFYDADGNENVNDGGPLTGDTTALQTMGFSPTGGPPGPPLTIVTPAAEWATFPGGVNFPAQTGVPVAPY